MGAGGNADGALPAMRHHEPATVRGELAHLARLGESAHPADVGLEDVYLATIDEVVEFEMGVLPFPGGNADGAGSVQVGIPVQVVDIQRSLDKKQVVRL